MPNKKIILNIKGMHCRSCEVLLESSIMKVRGVKSAVINHKTGIARVDLNFNPNMDEIKKAVEDAGYSLGVEDKKHFFSRNKKDYLELIILGSILFIIYLFLKKFGILNLGSNFDGNPGLLAVFIIGLTAGVSTCMALIGGLVLGISARHAEVHKEATVAEKFRPHLFFNLGRLVSYIILGGVIGLAGTILRLSSPLLGTLTVILGFVMLFLGFKLIEIFPRMHNKTITLPKGISKMFGIQNEIKEYSHKGAFITGALTFFVPCGFTQAMQLYAVSTGSFLQGALIMGIFALGTLPGIIGIGGLTSSIKGAFSRYFFKFAGLVVIVLAGFNIVSGYNLIGFNSSVKEYPNNVSAQQREINLVDGKQVIEMTQSFNGYSPREFVVKKDIPVVWKINSTSQFTCAAYISMPKYGISKTLESGKNILEFLPKEKGVYKFTCSMGMYSGIIKVID